MATNPRRPFAGTGPNPIPSTPDSLPDWLQVPYSGQRGRPFGHDLLAGSAVAMQRRPPLISFGAIVISSGVLASGLPRRSLPTVHERQRSASTDASRRNLPPPREPT